MNCKIGDYIIDKFGNLFHITSDYDKAIVNTNGIMVRHAEESEIEEYHRVIEVELNG